MTFSNKLFGAILMMFLCVFAFSSCDDDEAVGGDFDFTGVYDQADQKARPAINTVFVGEADKNTFNETTPSDMGAAFAAKFETRLLALNPAYTTNALTLDAPTFTGILATDVLNVSTTGTTTFFDGTNVLTGRNLTDDVIDVELLLIFGGTDGAANPGLTSDNVDSNDKAFLGGFPYLASPF
jgi:hypothetical protein